MYLKIERIRLYKYTLKVSKSRKQFMASSLLPKKNKKIDFKVHIFWEGHKILRNLYLTFDWHYIGQK